MLPRGHATSVEGPESSLLICISVRVYVWLSHSCSLLDLSTYPSCGHGGVRKQPSLGLIASLVYVYATAKRCSISRSSIRGWRFVCLLIKTGTLKSLDFSVKSFVSTVFSVCVCRGLDCGRRKWEFAVWPISFSLTVTTFFSSCRLMLGFFFLYPQVLSPLHRLKPEIIRSLSLLHLSLCHTFSNTFTFGNLVW